VSRRRSEKRTTNRRDFLKTTTLAGFGFWVSARNAFPQSKSANEKLNIAVIGCGGKGESDLAAVGENDNIVALCDVDSRPLDTAAKKYPQAKKYQDFRKLLEEEKSLDAVVVATPDHCHAPASVMAMKLGKHVYCQKPLTHSVYEARVMRETAAKMKVATQMGNQGTSENGFRRAIEVIQSGAIGQVKEAHIWSNRPIWPQGIERPEGSKPVPAYLNWDLWLGPAPERPYWEGEGPKGFKCYHPFQWRGWWDFGTGALGDMACHTANLTFMALKLEYPILIEAESSGVNKDTAPERSKIHFEFPARGNLPPLKFMWYDGGNLPPEELTSGLKGRGKRRKKDKEAPAPDKIPISGCLLVGTEGVLFSPDDYGATFQLFPEEKFAEYKGPSESLPRSPGHYKEWLIACKGGPRAVSNFDYAALLTETILLGNLAVRTGKKLDWDGPAMKAKNCPEADQYVKREYRKGYAL
jgi:hypothetical protein